jgi:hypothetical protein
MNQMITPLSLGEVEERILRLCEALEEESERYADLAAERADAEADFKYRHSRAFIEQNGKIPVATKEAVAQMRAANDFRRYRLLEARERATQSKLTSLRAQLEALRTIAANVRFQTR